MDLIKGNNISIGRLGVKVINDYVADIDRRIKQFMTGIN